MGRNKLVYTLTETTVVVASDVESGGTWAGATEALKKKLADVAVWLGDGQGPGNEQLVALGGRAITSPEGVFDVGASTAEPERVELA